MKSINVRNVNHALPLALALLRDTGISVAPRGLLTVELPSPFATTYSHPTEMVLYDAARDANPWFHLFESLWILHGRDDVQFLQWFLPRMVDFSDDGIKFHAPYGYRMRHAFGCDQIEFCIKALSEDHDTRQAVISIWNPNLDWKKTKDRPCNDLIMFKIRNNRLRMTVCNRSNDAILGAYGTNVVQFSTLLKYVAGYVGVEIGAYTQVSDSFHVYADNPFWVAWLAAHTAGVPWVMDDPYEQRDMIWSVHGNPLALNPWCGFMPPHEISSGAFDEDLNTFFEYWDENKGPSSNLLNERNYATDSFAQTVLPMLQGLINWRNGNRSVALEVLRYVKALDWQIAGKRWMNRRIERDAKR